MVDRVASCRDAVVNAVVLWAACVLCTGCITGQDGRLLGAASFNSLVSGLSHSNSCGCHRDEHGAPCGSCGAPSWTHDRDTTCDSGRCGPGDGEIISQSDWEHGAFDSEFGGVEGTYGCDESRSVSARRRWYEPEAGIFNFCVPPAAIGAPAPPPPGRFHPVPTRPVFSPRPTAVVAMPLAD
jgi:hypothetical protein